MLKLSMLLLMILSSCAHPQKPPEIIVTQKMVYPQLPHIQAPPKNHIEPIVFDWPRMYNYYSIKNTKKCKRKFLTIYPSEDPLSFKLKIDDPESSIELEQYSKFWYDCSILSIDMNSNIYIGLTEVEYKKLVTDFNIMLVREKQWQELLKHINDTIDNWRKKANEETSKDTTDGAKNE